MCHRTKGLMMKLQAFLLVMKVKRRQVFKVACTSGAKRKVIRRWFNDRTSESWRTYIFFLQGERLVLIFPPSPLMIRNLQKHVFSTVHVKQSLCKTIVVVVTSGTSSRSD